MCLNNSYYSNAHVALLHGLRNAAINAYRDFGRKQKHEASLDYLMSETLFEPFSTDNYFEQYVYEKPTIFVAKGQEVWQLPLFQFVG